MKAKLILGLIVAACLIVPFVNGAIVEAFADHATYLSTDVDTGDVYRVHERSRAYCDGTIVTRFRARRVSDCDNSSSCDNADAGGCSGNYGSQGGYGRGPRFFRGVRVHRYDGCDN
jgi:hypothetical protein